MKTTDLTTAILLLLREGFVVSFQLVEDDTKLEFAANSMGRDARNIQFREPVLNLAVMPDPNAHIALKLCSVLDD